MRLESLLLVNIWGELPYRPLHYLPPTLALPLAALFSLLLALAQPVSAEEWPPPEKTAGVDLRSAESIEQGRQTFNGVCAGYCHGSEGHAKRGPALRGRADLSVSTLYYTISNGRRRVDPMPAWKGVLAEEKIWQVIAYIVSLREAH